MQTREVAGGAEPELARRPRPVERSLLLLRRAAASGLGSFVGVEPSRGRRACARARSGCGLVERSRSPCCEPLGPPCRSSSPAGGGTLRTSCRALQGLRQRKRSGLNTAVTGRSGLALGESLKR